MLKSGFLYRKSLATILKNDLRNITSISVIGAGLMGSGIAQISAQSGYKVNMIDLDSDLLSKSVKKIEKSMNTIAKKKFKDDESGMKSFVDKSMSLLQPTTSIDGVKDSDLVIEAIVENIDIKHKLYKQLDTIAPSHCILASNTSSIPIRSIMSVTTRLDKCGGLHFFNPAPIMKLVEVISIPETSQETFESLLKFGQSVGKTTVKCKDTPGFIVNRLLVPYLGEAIRMLERGDASAPDIDTAMKLGANYPMGPLELADYVGLDTIQFILAGWKKSYPDNPLFNPLKTLDDLVAANKLGRKTGEGFYKYN